MTLVQPDEPKAIPARIDMEPDPARTTEWLKEIIELARSHRAQKRKVA